MHEDDRMRLIMTVAEALYEEWFPNGNSTDSELWQECALLDAEVAVDAMIRAGRLS